MKRNLILIAALVLIAAIWALTFPLTKIAAIGGYRNFGIIFWSSTITVFVLGILVAMRGLAVTLQPAALLRYFFVPIGDSPDRLASNTAIGLLPSAFD